MLGLRFEVAWPSSRNRRYSWVRSTEAGFCHWYRGRGAFGDVLCRVASTTNTRALQAPHLGGPVQQPPPREDEKSKAGNQPARNLGRGPVVDGGKEQARDRRDRHDARCDSLERGLEAARTGPESPYRKRAQARRHSCGGAYHRRPAQRPSPQRRDVSRRLCASDWVSLAWLVPSHTGSVCLTLRASL